MILGLGVDILDSRRIQRLIDKFGDYFISKYFNKKEIEFCSERDDFTMSLSKMFAIKESAIKAVSDTNGMKWHNLEVTHDEFGRPHIKLYCDKYGSIPNQKILIHTTTSDEPPYVVATTIIESLLIF